MGVTVPGLVSDDGNFSWKSHHQVECSSIMLTVNSKQREVHVVAPKFPAAARRDKSAVNLGNAW